jgi:DNA-binding phage protein
MGIEKVLRELVQKKGLRKVARDLGIDSASLYRSIQEGSNLKLGRIERLLGYFGYNLIIVKSKEVKQVKSKPPRIKRKGKEVIENGNL